MKIYRANYDSRNFSFEAYGKTSAAAHAALLAALLRHMDQYDLDADWYCKDDIAVQAFDLNTPYRDRAAMTGAKIGNLETTK